MKISKNEVIQANETIIRNFVPALMEGDDINTYLKRIGDRLSVSPDNSENDTVQVNIKPNMVIVVSKEGTLDSINDLLDNVLEEASSIGAIGLDPTGLMQPVKGLGGATIDLIREIAKTPAKQGNLNFSIPIHFEKSPNDELVMTCEVHGWTVTTDVDAPEEANFFFNADIEGADGNRIETKNENLNDQVEITKQNSEVKYANPEGLVNSNFESSWNVITDGDVNSVAVSLIQIAEIKLNYRHNRRG